MSDSALVLLLPVKNQLLRKFNVERKSKRGQSVDLFYFRTVMIRNYENLKFVSLSEVDSTNNYIANLVRLQAISQTTIVSADYQHEGRGQRATKWQSSKAQNALFSIYVPWENLKIADQFLISMLTALAVQEVLQEHVSSNVTIKWPNDIYMDTKKIGGILIESDLSGQNVSSSIIGIGINVNQTQFDSHIRATSLKLETGQTQDLEGLIRKIALRLVAMCLEVSNDEDAFNRIKQKYTRQLYSLNQKVKVRISASQQAMIIKPLDVSRMGLLLAVDEHNKLHSFDIKDITWEMA
jgi:BirA family biotin operon repressor/biotin-[acetyl-CoA-carboxylase] ligase